MKCLLQKNGEEFLNYVKHELDLTSWKIMYLSAKERLAAVQDFSYFITLKKNATDKNLHASDIEVLSWLDTTVLMYKIISGLTNLINLNELEILQEYEIPFTNKRADYVLTYQNKILIIEFSFDKMKDEYKYENKLTQALGYKELISNLVPTNIEIATYTFLLYPEIDSNWNKIKSNNDTFSSNKEKIVDMQNFIYFFFEKRNRSAIDCLNEIQNYADSNATHLAIPINKKIVF